MGTRSSCGNDTFKWGFPSKMRSRMSRGAAGEGLAGLGPRVDCKANGSLEFRELTGALRRARRKALLQQPPWRKLVVERSERQGLQRRVQR